MYNFKVREDKKIRVIVNTDAKNEADDQFAIVHACLTPKFIVKGIIAAQFGARRNEASMMESYDECVKVMDLMKLPEKINIYKGAKKEINSETDYEYSEGAKLIVDEAMSDDERPLYVVFLGPITDLACAYLHNPEIAEKMTVIWIGGGAYPAGGFEFNLSNDIKAANIILKSNVNLWQVPMNVYTKMLVTYAELELKVRPYGEIGRYLFDQMMEFADSVAHNPNWPKGESWSLGDSPTIGLMLDHQDLSSHMGEAPSIDENMMYHFDGKGRQIKIYDDINYRFILEDMFAKLQLNYEKK